MKTRMTKFKATMKCSHHCDCIAADDAALYVYGSMHSGSSVICFGSQQHLDWSSACNSQAICLLCRLASPSGIIDLAARYLVCLVSRQRHFRRIQGPTENTDSAPQCDLRRRRFSRLLPVLKKRITLSQGLEIARHEVSIRACRYSTVECLFPSRG